MVVIIAVQHSQALLTKYMCADIGITLFVVYRGTYVHVMIWDTVCQCVFVDEIALIPTWFSAALYPGFM